MIHKTKNLSFTKVFTQLRDKGVENNTFFLELKDKTLADVDPFDPNLTQDQKDRIIVECTLNPWYFIRECVRIPASGLIPFELHLGNLAFIWAVLNNFSVFLVLPRQCGKTFAAATIILWFLYFGGRNTEIMLYAQQDSNLKNNSGRIRALRENLPDYLKLYDQKDRDGQEEIGFKLLGNKILKQAPKRSEEGADAVGRGFSTPVVWYDEFAFIPHIKVQYQASVLAQSTIAKTAEKNGLPNCVMITTTAAFLNNTSGLYAYDFFNGSFEFNESLYDKSKPEILKLMHNEAKRNFIRIEYPYWELGKSDTYFEEQCKALGGDKDAIDREVLNKWKSVSTTHPLGQDAIALLDSNIRKPNSIVVLNDIYRMKLYKSPDTLDWSIPYIISGDCSNNVGEDYSALVITDPRNYEVIGTIRTNSYSTMLYAKMIATLMTDYFYNSVLVVERNLNGATILDRVIEIEWNLSSRIYAPLKSPEKPGIDTTAQSRKLLYNQILKVSVDDSYNVIHDSTIINEIKSLIRTRSGRIDHPSDGHDDMLISYLFGRWFLMFGEKIERYLDPLMVGLYSDITGENDVDADKRKKERKDQLLEYARQEKENVRAMFDTSGAVSIGSRVPTIQEQKDRVYSGMDGRTGSSRSDGIFGAAQKFQDRFDPLGIHGPADGEASDKKLYTLDDKEIEESMDETDDTDERTRQQRERMSQEQYHRNPKDIAYRKKPVEDVNQLQREILSERDNSTADLMGFMRQFRM